MGFIATTFSILIRLFVFLDFPYGETFFGKPTGRYSDGLVLRDYLAKAVGLPLLNPYRDNNASFGNGVNFAVAGATALSVSFFKDRGISAYASLNVHLNNQTEWFRQYLASTTSSSYDSIYQFGDSYLDNGNLIRVPGIGSTVPAASLPYGETFFGKPTGRYSDGLLVIDYLAKALKLPLLKPYLDRNASFVNGVNFAVAGATALDVQFFTDRGLGAFNAGNIPLTNQTQWFRQYLASISSSPNESSTKLRKSLVVLGEIGTNDLSYAFTQGISIQQLRTDYVPRIVQVILDNAREIIGLGATRMVVPGNFPLGCFPVTLLIFSQTNTSAQEYDEFGCSKSYNSLTSALNNQLQSGLASLRLEFPTVTVQYVDFYNAFFSVLARAPALDFNMGSSLLRACCGIGGQYNYNGNISACVSPGASLCPNPRRYIHWDGIHLTQEAHYRISEILIPTVLSKINCF